MAGMSQKSKDDLIEQEHMLLQVIRKIRIFTDISPVHGRSILTRCSKRKLKQGEILCQQGEESVSLFILILGKLSISIKHSATIATIHPIDTIGELGVFTGHPRNATVEAMEPSVVLELKKEILDAMIEKSPAMGVKIMRNVLQCLSERISEDNLKLREFQNYIITQENTNPSGS
jgi:CRP-like cAMP-binding protein